MPKIAEKKPAAKKKSTTRKKKKAGNKTMAAKKAKPAKKVLPGAVPDPAGLRVLEMRNKELDRTEGDKKGTELATGAEEIFGESQNILHFIKDLEVQVDNAFSLNEALEADLGEVQAKLVEETRVRSELQSRLQLFEAKASLVEQLQDELSFVEDERAGIARKLQEKESQLDQVTAERGALAKQMIAADARVNSLEQAKVDLEAQILNLEEQVADLRKIQEELVQMKGVREELKQQVKELTGQLGAVEISRKAFESDLAASRDLASGQEEGLKKYRKNLEAAHNRLADLSEQLEEQQLENRNLMETKRGLERVVKTLTAKNEVISADLDATKKALFEIHGAATRTSKRIHSRYYKSAKSKTE